MMEKSETQPPHAGGSGEPTTALGAMPGLKVERFDRVVWITLDRPERRNALDDDLERHLRAALHHQAADPDTCVIVLTGSDGCFCSGKDLRSLKPGAPPPPRSRSAQDHRFAFITRLPVPVIALIDGPAVGIGMMLALYCDLRIASSRAVFSTGFSRLGLVAEHGSAWLLPRLVGVGRAADLLLTSRLLQADDALRLGLVNQVVDPAQLQETGHALTQDLTDSHSPRSLREIKRQIWRDLETGFDEALRLAEQDQADSLQSEDAAEGLRAFMAQRPPRFIGR